MAKDIVDRMLEQWRIARPDVDVSAWAITVRINRLANYLQYQERNYESFGLNRGGVEVLMILRRTVPDHRLSPTDIYRGLLSTSATTTSRLDKLEHLGLVKRIPDPSDRRALLIELTPAGMDVADKILDTAMDIRSKQIAMLSNEDTKALASLLRKLLNSFEDAAESDTERGSVAGVAG